MGAMPWISYGQNSYGYDTESFITKAEAQKDRSFLVTEKITVDFQAVHHGLFRRIPYDPENSAGREPRPVKTQGSQRGGRPGSGASSDPCEGTSGSW